VTPVEPRTEQGRSGLRALVADAASALVALDFDGTLAPIVSDPDRARAHPEAAAALSALAGRVGHLAIVTGRPAATAVEYAGLRDAPDLSGLVVLGHYGLERWDPRTGEVSAPPPHPGVAQARRLLPGLLSGLDAEEAYVEDKGASLGVHTRRMSGAQGLHGLLICSGSIEENALAERADVLVEGPDGVVALLRALAQMLART
jgi:trehalose 6-phosphate phosphatase